MTPMLVYDSHSRARVERLCNAAAAGAAGLQQVRNLHLVTPRTVTQHGQLYDWLGRSVPAVCWAARTRELHQQLLTATLCHAEAQFCPIMA